MMKTVVSLNWTALIETQILGHHNPENEIMSMFGMN